MMTVVIGVPGGGRPPTGLFCDPTMPMAPKKPCSYPGCGGLTKDRYCDDHERATRHDYERARGSASARGYGRKWQHARAAWLRQHPLCRACEDDDVITAAVEVDHLIPHRGDKRLFWDRSNWQSMCKPCHSEKTAREDGRWG